MEQDWWKNAVVYQIYPQSFCDSNGDGFGDLNGVIEKLDYIARLGVNVIWLCPVYASPRVDNGYDIADYRRIDPAYGTNEDMWRLIAEADRRGIKILMDLVLNHTSSQHPWFQQAVRDPHSKYADYYLFRQGKNGKAPNNLRGYFSTPAWCRVGDGDRWYFHAFAPEQPDLNWENPQLRAEMVETINWWLEKGLGGFRLDAVCNLKKSAAALSNRHFRPDAADGLHSCLRFIFDQPGIEDFLEELAQKCFRPHHAFTVGEATIPARRLPLYTGETGVFSMLFDFSYVDIDLENTELFGPACFATKDFRRALFRSQADTQKVGWTAPCLENHDQPRSLSKYIPKQDVGPKSAKMLATLFLMLRGTPFVYQGQELGMANCPFELGEYQDVWAAAQLEQGLALGKTSAQMQSFFARRSRDHARTPMPWTGDQKTNAGFSIGQPWMKLNPSYQCGVNAEEEEQDAGSVLQFYRKLIALRRNSLYTDVLVNGTFRALPHAGEDVIAYLRSGRGRTVAVLCAFTASGGAVTLPQPAALVLSSNGPQEKDLLGQTQIKLAAYDAIVLELQPQKAQKKEHKKVR